MSLLQVPTGHDQSTWLEVQPTVESRLQSWEKARFAERLWGKDPTLWSTTPVPELTDRLGWLTLPETMQDNVSDLVTLAREVRAEGIRHVVLLGMGGSSLAPEVFQRTFGNAPGYPMLAVLDSTHPTAVRDIEEQVDVDKTLFLVSSKSGTTMETLSLFYYYWDRVMSRKAAGTGHSFVAITDPGTPLERLAAERGFRRVFQAPPDVGGRYSALSVFGLVPAALIGTDLDRLLRGAQAMVAACSSSVAETENPALALGAALGEMALGGRDKVTFIASAAIASFPTWIEQLIAESTGKEGRGITPVVDEELDAPEAYGRDRVFVYLYTKGNEDDEVRRRVLALADGGHPVIEYGLDDPSDIGGEFVRWEIAVAAAGAVLGIHPFNQPDVQLAKDLARQAMVGGVNAGSNEAAPSRALSVTAAGDETPLARDLDAWLDTARDGDYVGIHAYLAPSAATTAALQRVRTALRTRLRLATTVGYGPRFLHSTGQLHKGGPNTGLFLQITDEPTRDLSVPETDYSFGSLVRAQAAGDAMALLQRGRRVIRVELGRDAAGGLERLATAISRH